MVGTNLTVGYSRFGINLTVGYSRNVRILGNSPYENHPGNNPAHRGNREGM